MLVWLSSIQVPRCFPGGLLNDGNHKTGSLGQGEIVAAWLPISSRDTVYVASVIHLHPFSTVGNAPDKLMSPGDRFLGRYTDHVSGC